MNESSIRSGEEQEKNQPAISGKGLWEAFQVVIVLVVIGCAISLLNDGVDTWPIVFLGGLAILAWLAYRMRAVLKPLLIPGIILALIVWALVWFFSLPPLTIIIVLLVGLLLKGNRSK